MGELRYIDGIRTALETELARDPAVMVLGEDVTVGGPFGATKGLVDTFGRGADPRHAHQRGDHRGHGRGRRAGRQAARWSR